MSPACISRCKLSVMRANSQSAHYETCVHSLIHSFVSLLALFSACSLHQQMDAWQVAAVCDHLARIPQLSRGYNAVGFSQGSQFLRGVLERCQHNDGMPKMHKLITLGGQHQGIMNGPQCSGPSFNQTPSTPCKVVQRLLGFGAYLPWIRSHVVQAQYFKVAACSA